MSPAPRCIGPLVQDPVARLSIAIRTASDAVPIGAAIRREVAGARSQPGGTRPGIHAAQARDVHGIPALSCRPVERVRGVCAIAGGSRAARRTGTTGGTAQAGDWRADGARRESRRCGGSDLPGRPERRCWPVWGSGWGWRCLWIDVSRACSMVCVRAIRRLWRGRRSCCWRWRQSKRLCPHIG